MKNKNTPEDIKTLRSRLKYSELIQSSLYKIAEAAHAAKSLDDLYFAIHNIISKLMYAKNFYIAIFDKENKKLNFPFFYSSNKNDPVSLVSIWLLFKYDLNK